MQFRGPSFLYLTFCWVRLSLNVDRHTIVYTTNAIYSIELFCFANDQRWFQIVISFFICLLQVFFYYYLANKYSYIPLYFFMDCVYESQWQNFIYQLLHYNVLSNLIFHLIVTLFLFWHFFIDHSELQGPNSTIKMNIYIVGAKWSPRGGSTQSRVDPPQKLGRIDLGRIGTGADRPATILTPLTRGLQYCVLFQPVIFPLSYNNLKTASSIYQA